MALSLAGTWGSERLNYKDPVDISLRTSTITKVSIKTIADLHF
jgi:hypothetical protein